ncbi:hypothetical protein jhhlp_000351 [Lomentospora prolificans]|uniref:Grh/CP2 DB domain-containing protein n=1 Tax=Lomentospora prolificans TaxID=41688 RepID=A0A2N3NKQ1_9PEZI|nr:hypothetical protein jhhlp_000351 [Lomentospora prolificans]
MIRQRKLTAICLRLRRSSQKPGDELLANFRQQFPEVAAVGTIPPTGAPVRPGPAPVAGENGHIHDRTVGLPHENFRDQDPTPRATNEQWRFTPSLLDANSFAFAGFNHGAGGYYTPTPGGTNTIYHPQAGDLHTPTLGLGMGLNTPLSLSTSEATMHNPAAMMDLNHFQPMQMGQFNGGFVSAAPPQASFAPTAFVQHPDPGFETMDHDGPRMDTDEKMGAMNGFHSISPVVDIDGRPQYNGMHMAVPLPSAAEKFRFHATLNAPTAMIKHADEIPITYLNKGQAYSLCIVDTGASLPIAPGTRYRTFVRVSFEDEQQRQRPAACWSLWKEGRGTNEAHQRGGKLQAVEFIEARDPGEGDDKRTRIELETSSFDGFSVIWTPGVNGAAEVNIAVRFNFLSTDFSHSKGVKGIPVRLCAKTSYYPIDTSKPPPNDGSVEICFCKAKLFRDHGAERKLSNDIAHVKKTIDKLKQQIAQVESGMKDFGKRKRAGGSNGNKVDPQRPGKVQKHKRTWSMSSTGSANGTTKPPAEDDWHVKLQTLQDMFTSTRPVSILFLRGEELDDPDTHPVALPGDPDFSKFEDRNSASWQARSGRSSVASSSLVSPSTRSPSLASQVSATGMGQWSVDGSDNVRAHSDKFMIKKNGYSSSNLSGWIEALGVDPNYRPPPEREMKPVACFYILRQEPGAQGNPGLYRAVYLMKRTQDDLKAQIGSKWDMEPSKIQRLIRVMPNGIEVEVDDDLIREVAEGQDMIMEVTELNNGAPVKSEWEMMIDTGDNEVDGSQHPKQRGYELKLHF